MKTKTKIYFYRLEKLGYRTERKCAVITGVVLALNEDEAREKAWNKSGSDYAYGLDVWEVTDGTFDYYIPV